MKRILLYMCMVVSIPLQLKAQINTSDAQKYKLWTVLKTIDCNHMPPGAIGSSHFWDFSALTPINPADTHRVQYIAPTSNMLYPNASMVKKDGLKYTFYDYQPSGVYVLGSVDSSNSPPDTLMFSNSMQIMKHPITYTNSYRDTFKANEGKADSTKGYVIDTVTSFGSLILPHDTFENVIKMEFTIVMETTVSGLPTTITEVSNQWYNRYTSSPLLRIDSTLIANTSGNTTTKRAIYLLQEDPVSIPNIETEMLDFSAIMTDNKIVITTGLLLEHNYTATLYDLSGRKKVQAVITGGNNQTIHLNTYTTAGIYILSVQDNQNTSELGVIRLMKQ